jgi:hypothetical protein
MSTRAALKFHASSLASRRGEWLPQDEHHAVRTACSRRHHARCRRRASRRRCLHNIGSTPAVAVKLTLRDASTHERILPAYYSDNYVSLLPDETLHLNIYYLAATHVSSLELGERGWNLAETSTHIAR